MLNNARLTEFHSKNVRDDADKTLKLGLILVLADYCKSERGRFKNLLDKLSKTARNKLANTPPLERDKLIETRDRLIAFESRVEWAKVKIPVFLYTNFLLAILDEDDRFDDVIQILNRIADYFMRAGNNPEDYYDDAAKALDIFHEVCGH